MDYRTLEMQKVEKDKLIHNENLKIVESLKSKDSDIFDLDIGGTHKISTSKNTLTKVYYIIQVKKSFQIQLWLQCFQEIMKYPSIMDMYL